MFILSNDLFFAALREDHNPANLIHRVNNSGLFDYDALDSGALKIMYYRHRYTDPFTGRFLQQDPFGISDSIFSPLLQITRGSNIYLYTSGNPTSYADCFGLADYAIGTGITPFPPGYYERYPGWNIAQPTQRDFLLWQQLFEAANKSKNILPNASARLLHYLGNSGSSLGIPVTDLLIQSPQARNGLRQEINTAMDFVESASKGKNEYWQFNIYSRQWSPDAVSDNWDWYLAVHRYHRIGRGSAEYLPTVFNSNGKRVASCKQYSLHLTYQVWDAFDWHVGTNFGPVAGADIKLLHFRGIAQEYNGSGAYDITVKWLEGTRISNIKKYWIERGLVIDLRFPFAQNLL